MRESVLRELAIERAAARQKRPPASRFCERPEAMVDVRIQNEEGNDALPKNLKQEVGVSEILKDGDYYFVTMVNKILPAGPKSLDECKGKVINDYQQYLEQNWVNELKKEFTIKTYPEVFEKVKTELKK